MPARKFLVQLKRMFRSSPSRIGRIPSTRRRRNNSGRMLLDSLYQPAGRESHPFHQYLKSCFPCTVNRFFIISQQDACHWPRIIRYVTFPEGVLRVSSAQGSEGCKGIFQGTRRILCSRCISSSGSPSSRWPSPSVRSGCSIPRAEEERVC